MNKILETVQRAYQRVMGHRRPIDSIELSVHDKYILAIYKGPDDFENFMYSEDGTGCKVSCGPIDGTWKDSNFVDEFLKDVGLMLENDIMSLTSFWLGTREMRNNNYSMILEALKPILESRATGLKVRELIMDVLDANQIPLILPYLDSSFLESIRISDPTSHENWRRMEDSEDGNTERWKKSKKVQISTAKFPNSLKHFLRFPNVIVFVDEMEIEDMDELIKTVLHSPIMNYFCLNFQVFENYKLVVDHLGTSSIIKDSWYFRMTNSSDVLGITSKDQFQQIEFHRISESEVPEGVVIQDGTLL